MKTFRILIILFLIIGASLGILFFSSLTYTHQSESVRPPLFIVRNMDLNHTHSVEIQITNESGTILDKRIYNPVFGNNTMADIPAPEHNLDVFFHALVDGKKESEILLNMSPTKIAVIEIGSTDDPYPVSFSVIDVTPKRI